MSHDLLFPNRVLYAEREIIQFPALGVNEDFVGTLDVMVTILCFGTYVGMVDLGA